MIISYFFDNSNNKIQIDDDNISCQAVYDLFQVLVNIYTL